ncbi:MAG: DOMON-like domain-containing protein [Candidatus Cloacimonetes bacterium]|nr:DOMON-like domain-containing protein [Candidatus Cloacimonadota bacterium]
MLRLEPHPSQRRPPGLELQVRLSRSPESLSVCFQLHDPRGLVRLPAPVSHPERREGLWRRTCFELFLAREGSSGYRELNLSPAGHWNLFHFEGYRQPGRVSWSPAELPFRCRPTADGYTLELVLPLRPLELHHVGLELGVCAVLSAHDGECGHWALCHPDPGKPDFHLRRGFALTLAAVPQDEAEL